MTTRGWLFCFAIFAVGIFLGATIDEVRWLLLVIAEWISGPTFVPVAPC